MNKNNKTDNNIYIPNWLKNILYLIGIIVVAFPFLMITYFQIKAANYNNDIEVSFNIFDYIYSINWIVAIFVLIVPAIILDKAQNVKLLYSVGLNLDRFAFRDIVIGIFFATIGIGIILLFANNYTTNYLFLQNIILGTLGTAFGEELLFRGYIFQNIYRKNNSILAIIISSLLFAITHFINANFEVIYFLNIFIAGILFCVMYIKTKSLWCSIAFHFAWNLILNIFNENLLEHHFICGIVLLIFIFITLKLFKPSYKINSYYLIKEN